MPIRPTIRKIGNSTAIYGVGNLLSKIAAVFLIPIYTRYLTLTEVGILALLEMMEIFLVTIAPMGMNNALWKFLPSKNKHQQRQIIFSAFIGTLFLNIIILGFIALNYNYPAAFLGLQLENEILLLLVILNVFLAFGFRFILTILQYREKAVSYILLSISQFVGILLVTIDFVVFRNWGLWGVLFAKTVVTGIIFLAGGVVILKRYSSLPSLRTFSKLIKFGFPFVIFALVMPFLTFSDRFFLRLFDISLSDIGIYNIAYKFGMIINMILVIPLQRGWVPMMFKLGVEEKSHEYFRDILFYYAFIGAVIFLAISFFAEGIITLFATEVYLPGVAIVPLIALAYLINGFRQFFVAGIALQEKTGRLGIASLIGILVNLILNYFLIGRYGIWGAAWSTVISYSFLTGLIYISSLKFTHINWGWNRLIRLSAILLVVFLTTSWMQTSYQTYQNILALSGLSIFIALSWLFGVIGQREISGIKYLFQSLRIPSVDKNS